MESNFLWLNNDLPQTKYVDMEEDCGNGWFPAATWREYLDLLEDRSPLHRGKDEYRYWVRYTVQNLYEMGLIVHYPKTAEHEQKLNRPK